MQELVIKVGGMSCQGCARSVSGALEAMPGVERVEVSLEAGEARVSYRPGETSGEQMCQAIEAAGFEAECR